MVLKCILALVFCIALVASLPFLAGLSGISGTDYQQELGKIEASIHAASISRDPQNLLQQAYYAFLKSALTGNRHDMEKTEAAFEKALARFPESIELQILHAAYYLKLHRLDAAKTVLAKLSFMDDDPKVRTMKADIAVQEGDYRDAVLRYEQVIARDRSWDNLSRLAYLRAKHGDFAEADRLYREAEENISAKEMRSYAWVKLQRGYLALSRGQYEAAWEYYRRAEQAYSGYWLTKEYMAELLGAQKNFDAAAILYRQLIHCAKRPELYHALGDLYFFMGKPDLAKPWHDKALAIYLASANRGEVQYYHHLASLYADARRDGAEAVRWAQKDIDLRQNAATRDMLAWALYRAGRYPEALIEIRKTLAYKWQDAHLFFHAAMIYLAAGQTDRGRDYLQKAAMINPNYGSFHVHR